MKIHSHAYTKISGFICFTFLSLNSAIAYSQEKQNSYEDTTHLIGIKMKTLPSIPKKIKLEILKPKAVLAIKSEIPSLPTLKVVATKVVLTKLKQLPNKKTSLEKGLPIKLAVQAGQI